MAARLPAHGWVAIPAEGGHCYFFHRETGHTTWDLPPGLTLADIPVAVTAAQAASLESGGGAGSGGAALAPMHEGWCTKSDKTGKQYKRRWLVANARTAMLSWFNDNPSYSLAGVGEGGGGGVAQLHEPLAPPRFECGCGGMHSSFIATV
jgi:hypothetical protein